YGRFSGMGTSTVLLAVRRHPPINSLEVKKQVPVGRIMHNAAAAQGVERGRYPFAARHDHLRQFFLCKVCIDLDQRAVRATEFTCQCLQHCNKPMTYVTAHHAVQLRISVCENTAQCGNEVGE